MRIHPAHFSGVVRASDVSRKVSGASFEEFRKKRDFHFIFHGYDLVPVIWFNV